MTHIFISYSRHDQTYARRLVADLQAQGFPVWIDWRIEPADEWWDKIEQAIRDCAAFIIIMTEEAQASRWVKTETALAKDQGKIAFPLLLDGENWGMYADIQYTDVRDQRLPPNEFYERLAGVVPPTPSAIRELRSDSIMSPLTAAATTQTALLVDPVQGRASIQLFHEAKEEYWVKAMGLDRLRIDINRIMLWLQSNTSYRIRFLLPDPALEEMCQRIDQYLGNYHPLVQRLEDSLRSLNALQERFPERVQIHLLPHRPATGCAIIDPGTDNSFLRLRIYHYRMDAVAQDHLPFIYLHKNDPSQAKWYDAFLQDFITEWDGATEWIARVHHALPDYETRLQARALDRPDFIPLAKPDGAKFHSDGTTKPFDGTTCITMIEPTSALFKTLTELQTTLKRELADIGAGHVFSFLAPESLHMTICDIDAGEQIDPNLDKGQQAAQIEAAFARIQVHGPITAQVRGLGLTGALTALVRFDDKHMLRRVLNMEHHIKTATGVNRRDFAGHISLAYMVQSPGEKLPEIQALLQSYDGDFGPLTFSTVDFAAFSDMNTYLPLITLDHTNGQITPHQDNLREWLT